MTYLLDVNVLIALTDRSHVHHHAAQIWFESVGQMSWATCPITENGVIRIVGNQRYRNSVDGLSYLLEAVKEFTALPGHVFWSDDVTLINGENVDLRQAITPNHVTDIYLLFLAQTHGGQLATLDRKIPVHSVANGSDSLCIIPV